MSFMQNEANPPKGVVRRMSLYLRELRRAVNEGRATISSLQLGHPLGIKAAQVRRDMAYVGPLGQVGVGYPCDELIERIKSFLAMDRAWPVALVGCGNLGQALLGYAGFATQGFRIAAAFDTDPRVVGTARSGICVQPMEALPTAVREHHIQLAILAVPAADAQRTAEAMVSAGIVGIMNFAPVTLVLPDAVHQIAVDLAIDLEQLAYGVATMNTTR